MPLLDSAGPLGYGPSRALHFPELGVESICTALQIAPSTYYAAKRRQSEPSTRARRDAAMLQVLMVLWVANRKVYGAHKLWRAARRAGHDIGRDQVARLMRTMQIQGVSRQRRKVFTTRQDPDATRAPDLVDRNFTADRPDALWVTDITYVHTRSGMGYVCFIVDAFSRRIVGWRVASNMKTDMVLDALRDGTTLTRRPATDRSRDTFGCGVAIHVRAIHRTSR
jgi:putative transposase